VPDTAILASVKDRFAAGPPARLGVAVSGGGDSVALLHILSRCLEGSDTTILAATVDHGLRPEAAQEATRVANWCQSLGICHATLKWRGWDGSGNLQDRARHARYQLLGDWAKSRRIPDLAVGHTADDQAETVLMRLGRAAGVAGLAAMPVRRSLDGVTLVRPLLHLGREDLRGYLRRNDLDWVEDPSNDDPRYDRVRARQALRALAPLGITTEALSMVAVHMQEAGAALDWYSFLAARDIVRVDGGDVLIDRRALRTQPAEIARRLVVRAVTWINASIHPPRRASVSAVMASARSGKSMTLGGCRVLHHDDSLRICREYNAVRQLRCAAGACWDRRWRLSGPDPQDCELRPLGRRGLMQCPDWRDSGRPHAALLASPSVWRGDDLVAAPLAGLGQGWNAEIVGGADAFFASLLSH
jgi:tRNA(Ile)-lysidine synthase